MSQTGSKREVLIRDRASAFTSNSHVAASAQVRDVPIIVAKLFLPPRKQHYLVGQWQCAFCCFLNWNSRVKTYRASSPSGKERGSSEQAV
jgi:hypothetical protein